MDTPTKPTISTAGKYKKKEHLNSYTPPSSMKYKEKSQQGKTYDLYH